MKRKSKLICYYSDIYKSSLNQGTIRILIIDSSGDIIYKRGKRDKNIKNVGHAKRWAFKELFSAIKKVEEGLSHKEKLEIDIISFDKKGITFLFENKYILPNFKTSNINNFEYKILKHENYRFMYNKKAREIFEKIYFQNILKKEVKKLKGYKLSKKKTNIRKVENVITHNTKKLVFFDVEMNCVDKKDNTLGYWEIVSLGACSYDASTNKTQKFYTLIKPKVQRVLSERCIKITSLNQNEIDKAPDFDEAMNKFQRFIGNGEVIFMSWGREDIRALKANYKLEGNEHSLVNQIRKKYVDFQKEFSFYNQKSNQVISLVKALEIYNIDFKGSQHNALDDAYNLYKVYENYKIEECEKGSCK